MSTEADARSEAGLPAAEDFSPRGRFTPFLLLSLATHGALVLAFQITYPPQVTIPPPDPRISLLTGSDPEQAEMLRWIAAEDPALVVAASKAVPSQPLASAQYRPSFSEPRTPPRTSPPQAESPAYPPAIPLATLMRAVDDTPSREAAAAPSIPTRVRLSGGIEARTWRAEPSIRPPAAATLENAQFLIGVSPSGEIRHVFLQRSAGDHEVDERAAAALSRATLSPANSGEIAWGIATVAWGNDGASGSPAQTAAASPNP